jgi:Domain of unknown function (DUF222)/HNH endonuclease
MFAAIAAAVDAHAAPRTADDDRSAGERQAEALADVCGYVLDHAEVPARGGERPHLSVIVRWEDLENRARAGCLELGGDLSPEALRMLCCDARVVHIVPWENGEPTSLANCCMLCRSCHRLVHHGGWDVHLREGVPEFYPPMWIDPSRSPRGRPRHLAPVA